MYKNSQKVKYLKRAKVLYALTESLKDIKAHPKIGTEIVDLILGSGHEREFFKLFKKRLDQAKLLKHEVSYLKEFEKLSGYPNLYSMHLESNNFNLRILYSYNQRDEVLLHCFYEREGKLHTSYDLHAPIAIDRMKEMEEYI